MTNLNRFQLPDIGNKPRSAVNHYHHDTIDKDNEARQTREREIRMRNGHALICNCKSCTTVQ